eukprot:3392038-Prymnesium_polylepis.1
MPMARHVVARAVAALVKCSVAVLKRTAVSWRGCMQPARAAGPGIFLFHGHAKGYHKHNTQ